MNKILIVDASNSDCRLMSGLLARAGYESVIAEDMEAKLLGISERALLEQRKRHGINKKGQVES